MFDPKPITIEVDGLGIIMLSRLTISTTAVDINGKRAWTYMKGQEETQWYVNEDIRRWNYLNLFKAS